MVDNEEGFHADAIGVGREIHLAQSPLRLVRRAIKRILDAGAPRRASESRLATAP